MQEPKYSLSVTVKRGKLGTGGICVFSLSVGRLASAAPSLGEGADRLAAALDGHVAELTELSKRLRNRQGPLTLEEWV